MSQTWQSDEISAAGSSPATDIPKLTGDLESLRSGFSGSGRPATADLVAGQQYLNTNYAANTWALYRVVDPANSALDALIELIDTTTGLRTPVASGKTFDHINIVRRGNAGGTVNAITATLSPTLSALADGVIAFVEAAGANTSTTPTFAPDGLSAKTIKKFGNQALEAGNIYGAGHVLILRYDAGNDVWELMNPAAITSSNSSIRLHTRNGFGSINTKVRRFLTVAEYIGTDITYVDSATLGAYFVINTSDVYSISTTDSSSSSGYSTVGISLNSTQLTTNIASINSADILAFNGAGATNFPSSCAWSGHLPAGSIIRAHKDGLSGTDVQAFFSIARVR